VSACWLGCLPPGGAGAEEVGGIDSVLLHVLVAVTWSRERGRNAKKENPDRGREGGREGRREGGREKGREGEREGGR